MLIERNCPLCRSQRRDTVVTLAQKNFTLNNASYRIDHLHELGCDPKQVYPIVRCADCQMVYSFFHLDDAAEDVLYHYIIDEHVSRAKVVSWGRRCADMERWLGLLSLVRPQKKELKLKVLDFGCGWATLLQIAQAPGVEVVGFDTTRWKTQWAREQGVRIVESVEELAQFGPFDLCISTSVLEHLKDPVSAVKMIAELLVPDGYALLAGIVGDVADPAGWRKIQKKLKQGETIPKEINPWEHLNYFTYKHFAQMLQSCGFKRVDTPGRWLPADQETRSSVKLLVRKLVRVFGLMRFMGDAVAVTGYWQLVNKQKNASKHNCSEQKTFVDAAASA